MMFQKEIMDNKNTNRLYFILKAMAYIIVGVKITFTVLIFVNIRASFSFTPYLIPSVFGLPAFLLAAGDSNYATFYTCVILIIFSVSLISYPTSFLLGVITFKTKKFDTVFLSILSFLGLADLMLMAFSHDPQKLISCSISAVFLVITGTLIFVNVRNRSNCVKFSTKEDNNTIPQKQLKN